MLSSDDQSVTSKEELQQRLTNSSGTERVDVLVELGLLLRANRSHLEQAKSLLDEAISLAKDLGDKERLAWAFRCRTQVLWAGDLDFEAAANALNSARIYRELGEMELEYWSHYDAFTSYWAANQPHQSQLALDRAFPLAVELQDQEKMAHCFLAKADLEMQLQGPFQKIDEALNEAERLYAAIGDVEGILEIYDRRALCLVDQNRELEAIPILQDAIRFATALVPEELVRFQCHLADALDVEGLHAEALAVLDAAHAKASADGRQKPLADVFYAMIDPLLHLGRFTEAATHLHRAKAMYQELGDELGLEMCANAEERLRSALLD